MSALLFSALSCLALAESENGRADAGANAWSEATFTSLGKSGDADALLAAHLLARWLQDPRADGYLAKAYERGQNNAKVLWYASVSTLCTVERPKECEKSVESAHRLTLIDGGNAMAWATLAWAADQQLHAPGAAHPELIKEGLRGAAAAKSVHDYGFDLTRVFVRETGRVRPTVPSHDAVQEQADENSRVALAMMMGQTGQEVVSWVRGGCGAEQSLVGEVAPLCKSAAVILERGDSVRTLPAEKAEALRAALSKGNEAGSDTAAHTRFLIESIAASNSEEALAERLTQAVK